MTQRVLGIVALVMVWNIGDLPQSGNSYVPRVLEYPVNKHRYAETTQKKQCHWLQDFHLFLVRLLVLLL